MSWPGARMVSTAAGGGGGGVSKLLAGPNITLDPEDGEGDVEVSAAGMAVLDCVQDPTADWTLTTPPGPGFFQSYVICQEALTLQAPDATEFPAVILLTLDTNGETTAITWGNLFVGQGLPLGLLPPTLTPNGGDAFLIFTGGQGQGWGVIPLTPTQNGDGPFSVLDDMPWTNPYVTTALVTVEATSTLGDTVQVTVTNGQTGDTVTLATAIAVPVGGAQTFLGTFPVSSGSTLTVTPAGDAEIVSAFATT